jgi:hypothetical protein
MHVTAGLGCDLLPRIENGDSRVVGYVHIFARGVAHGVGLVASSVVALLLGYGGSLASLRVSAPVIRGSTITAGRRKGHKGACNSLFSHLGC